MDVGIEEDAGDGRYFDCGEKRTREVAVEKGAGSGDSVDGE